MYDGFYCWLLCKNGPWLYMQTVQCVERINVILGGGWGLTDSLIIQYRQYLIKSLIMSVPILESSLKMNDVIWNNISSVISAANVCVRHLGLTVRTRPLSRTGLGWVFPVNPDWQSTALELLFSCWLLVNGAVREKKMSLNMRPSYFASVFHHIWTVLQWQWLAKTCYNIQWSSNFLNRWENVTLSYVTLLCK